MDKATQSYLNQTAVTDWIKPPSKGGLSMEQVHAICQSLGIPPIGIKADLCQQIKAVNTAVRSGAPILTAPSVPVVPLVTPAPVPAPAIQTASQKINLTKRVSAKSVTLSSSSAPVAVTVPPTATQFALTAVNESLYSYVKAHSNPNSPQDTPVKLACFDLDDTLITTNSGAKFATDARDWRFQHQSVPAVLQELYQQGYLLLVFSNQKGISKGTLTVNVLQDKLRAIVDILQTQFQTYLAGVFIATHDDVYRKPQIGMWTTAVDTLHLKGKYSAEQSFYCGDAAGRSARAGSKADFSFADIFFAHNIGIRFYLPEQIFESAGQGWGAPFQLQLSNKSKFKKSPYDSGFLDKFRDSNMTCKPHVPDVSHQPELIIMIGPPGCGKSTISRRYQQAGYVRINLDELKTKAKCQKTATMAISNGNSVVVDNTNPDQETRQYYLDLVKKSNQGYRTRAIVLTTPIELCHHLNAVRVHLRQTDSPVPQIAYNLYKSRYQPPTVGEFDVVQEVEFCPSFGSEAERQAFDNLYIE